MHEGECLHLMSFCLSIAIYYLHLQMLCLWITGWKTLDECWKSSSLNNLNIFWSVVFYKNGYLDIIILWMHTSQISNVFIEHCMNKKMDTVNRVLKHLNFGGAFNSHRSSFTKGVRCMLELDPVSVIYRQTSYKSVFSV